MKSIIKSALFFAVAAMAFSACTKNVEEQEPEIVNEIAKIQFSAVVNEAETRATLTPNAEETAFAAAWEVGDEMAIEALSTDADYMEEGTATWNGTFFDTTLPADETRGEWNYSGYYPAKTDIAFGSSRVQNGSSYNSAYDIMKGDVTYQNAFLGKDPDGGNMVIPMNRLTSILYFHLKSELNEPLTSATLTVEGGDIAGTAEINNGAVELGGDASNTITLTFAENSAPSANDFCLWFNILPVNATSLTLTVTTATKTATLSNTNGKTYEMGKLNKVVKNGLTWNEADLPDAVFFEERFSEANGLDGWSGSAAAADFKSDNDGWTATASYSGNKAAKFGTSKKDGNAQTPEISIPTSYQGKTLNLSFKAGAWAGDQTELSLSADGATLSQESVTLIDSEWKVYDLTISNITKSPITISFVNSARWLLDDVLVYYGTKPIASNLIVSPSEDQVVGYLAGTKDYSVSYTIDDVESNDWSVSTSSEGFSVVKNTEGTGFTVSYTQNNGAERTGEIVVTAGSKTNTVIIIQAEKSWTDELTATKIGVSTATYTDWNDIADNTGVKYAGNSAKSNNGDIQLRSTSNSGIVSTTTVGVIRKVVIDWGTMSQVRTLDIYGSNTAYSSSANLYSSSAQGTKIGSLTWNSESDKETELIVDDDFAYVGVRSNSNALYLNSIKFTYEESDPSKPKFGAQIIGDAQVSATTTSVSVGVTGNVAWTASATNGASVNPTSGTGEGTITITLPENTSFEQTASYVVTVSTTADVNTKSYNLTFTQDKAINPDANDGSLEKPYTVAEALAIINGYDSGDTSESEVYVKGKVSEVGTSINATHGSMTYKISDDGENTTTLTVFGGLFVANVKFSSTDQLTIGDIIIVYGKLIKFNTTPEINQNNYIYSLNGITKALTIPTLETSKNDAAKTITVTWGAVSGSEETISYVVTCGGQSHNANSAGSHTFTMSEYDVDYAISVVASASDAYPSTANTTVKLVDPNSGSGGTEQTIYLETFGSTSSNTALAAYNGYSATVSMFTNNDAVKTHYSGSGSVGKNNLSEANLSNGYTDASGLSGCYHGGTANTQATIIQISDIDISGCSDLILSFGALGGSTSHKINVSYIVDNGTETALITNGSITNANWTLLSESIPASGNSLTLIFKHTPTKAWTIRMDDIKVVGKK